MSGHGFTPPGFAPCPREPNHEGPCAHAFDEPETKAALCQCIRCFKYLAQNRLDDGSFLGNCCTECAGPNALPLAVLRGGMQDPVALELLALLTEECGETSQRVGKILRWGWEADFEGTTQQHKLEVELGDVLAVITLLVYNGLISDDNVWANATKKLAKFREDAAGPRQRLLYAEVPPDPPEGF